MSCKIIKNTDGKINNILDQTDNPSTLFKQILNCPTLSLEEAIAVYSNIYSEKLQSKVQFQILGKEGAKNLDQAEEVTYRMDNLLVARDMEAAGKTPKEIKLATSWEKGSEFVSLFQNKKEQEVLDYIESLKIIKKVEC